ncbi:MAG: cob(I)yrinic acid a,c-diamide adenosyltransferase [Lachnospiraceae bacterium]|nr:cob(I)yrinic acid a,c-diamide adenosyltransferase [Lachnospiraceae bacterium]
MNADSANDMRDVNDTNNTNNTNIVNNTSDAHQNTGLIHIYCGDGKGKTTTGMGLCARAAGYGLRVLIYQFMKDNSTSERKVLALSENITLVDGLPQEKFSFQMTAAEKAERKAYYENQLRAVTRIAQEEGYDVLFLDEVIYTIRAGLLEESLLLDFLREKPARLEVILTGQEPGRELLEMADYVSEIRKVRHPFDRGIRARGGIES